MNEEPITSPCKQECCYDPDLKLCISCGRRMHEIENYRDMTPLERRMVNAKARARLDNLKQLGIIPEI